MTNALNTAELTAIHSETLSEIRLEKTLANIARRAETLFSEGYKLNWNGQLDPYGVNYVHGPKGQLYRVNHWDGDGEFPQAEHSCDCAAWAKFGTCKHYQAVALRAKEEAEAAAYEATEADRDAFYHGNERYRKYDYRD